MKPCFPLFPFPSLPQVHIASDDVKWSIKLDLCLSKPQLHMCLMLCAAATALDSCTKMHYSNGSRLHICTSSPCGKALSTATFAYDCCAKFHHTHLVNCGESHIYHVTSHSMFMVCTVEVVQRVLDDAPGDFLACRFCGSHAMTLCAPSSSSATLFTVVCDSLMASWVLQSVLSQVRHMLACDAVGHPLLRA